MTGQNDVIEKLRMEFPEDLIETLRREYRECAEKETLDIKRKQTGVSNAEIVSALHTWEEIENDVARQDRYELVSFADRAKVELMQAQVRATLLQAAQLKRIADALGDIRESESLAESVRIWGTG